jgi:hypothetical protein
MPLLNLTVQHGRTRRGRSPRCGRTGRLTASASSSRALDSGWKCGGLLCGQMGERLKRRSILRVARARTASRLTILQSRRE